MTSSKKDWYHICLYWTIFSPNRLQLLSACLPAGRFGVTKKSESESESEKARTKEGTHIIFITPSLILRFSLSFFLHRLISWNIPGGDPPLYFSY
jgi:hypothetical protein